MFENKYMNNQYPAQQMPQPNLQQLPMYCRIDGDKIVQMQGQIVGYTVKAYEEAVSLAEEYEKVLIDHKLLEKELTPEEAMQDISKKMDRILGSIDGLGNRVSALEEMVTNPVIKEAEA